GRVPQTRQPIGLDDEKEDDQPAENHQLNIRNQVSRHSADKQGGSVVNQYGQQDNKRRPQKRAQNATQTTDDHHKEQPEGTIEFKRRDIHRGQKHKAIESTSDAGIERTDSKR